MHRLLLICSILVLAACEREVAVGHELAGVGDSGGSAGSGSDGSLLWQADHEIGSLDEWIGDDGGWRYTQGTGSLGITSERARSGEHSIKATISTENGDMHQAVIGRNLTLESGRYGAWYYFPEAPDTDYWVIMKLSNGRYGDLFDIDVTAPGRIAPRLRLYEHGRDFITPPAEVELPIGAWVHIEALYRSTPQSNGRLIVLQDGEPILDTGYRATADDANVSFIVGSVSWWIAGGAYDLYIDDASIEPAHVP
jgi:hypothetical protein